MRGWLFIFFILSLALRAQDKLFFINGSTKKGIIVSVAKDAVYFKDSDSAQLQKIPKSTLAMAENYRGVRYLFSDKSGLRDSMQVTVPGKRNAFGMQPLAVLIGRATFVYERFTADHKVGFVIPLSLTFDPIGSLYRAGIDTSRNAHRRIRGVNFIGGIDVNFYLGRNAHAQFFIGPRARYGTDMLLRGIEAYTLQTQAGWRFDSPRKKFSQYLSVGFGFARILSSPAGRLVTSKQAYGWYSINYRISINW